MGKERRKSKETLVRNGAKDEKYVAQMKIYAAEEKGINEILEGRVIVEQGRGKLKEIVEKEEKTNTDIEEMVERLPGSIERLKRRKTTRTVKEVGNALKKARERINRVKGTQKTEIENGEKKVTGSYALPGEIRRKLKIVLEKTRD